MDKQLAAMKQYFQAMVTYKVASIISTMTNFQVKLLSSKDSMTPEEMDLELNKLETIRRVVATCTKPADESK